MMSSKQMYLGSNALASYLWSHSISWCLAEGHGNRDCRPMDAWSTGLLLHCHPDALHTHVWKFNISPKGIRGNSARCL